MIVVIDTNILIDAWRDDFSYTRKIIDAIISGEITAVASHKIWREYQTILDRLVNDQDHYDLAQRLFSAMDMVNVRSREKVVKYDPDDDKFFNCALDGEAEYIISNDSHLWEIGEYKGIKVKQPKDFWLEYEVQNRDGGEVWKDWMKQIMGR